VQLDSYLRPVQIHHVPDFVKSTNPYQKAECNESLLEWFLKLLSVKVLLSTDELNFFVAFMRLEVEEPEKFQLKVSDQEFLLDEHMVNGKRVSFCVV